MKLYLAGPMSGIPKFNYPLFLEGAAWLRSVGFDVHCPAEMDSPEVQAVSLTCETGTFEELHAKLGTSEGATWGDFLKEDVKIIADEVDGVCLLPDWFTSRGARLEAFVAVNVGKPIYFLYGASSDSFVFVQHSHRDVLDIIHGNTLAQGDVSRYE